MISTVARRGVHGLLMLVVFFSQALVAEPPDRETILKCLEARAKDDEATIRQLIQKSMPITHDGSKFSESLIVKEDFLRFLLRMATIEESNGDLSVLREGLIPAKSHLLNLAEHHSKSVNSEFTESDLSFGSQTSGITLFFAEQLEQAKNNVADGGEFDKAIQNHVELGFEVARRSLVHLAAHPETEKNRRQISRLVRDMKVNLFGLTQVAKTLSPKAQDAWFLALSFDPYMTNGTSVISELIDSVQRAEEGEEEKVKALFEVALRLAEKSRFSEDETEFVIILGEKVGLPKTRVRLPMTEEFTEGRIGNGGKERSYAFTHETALYQHMRHLNETKDGAYSDVVEKIAEAIMKKLKIDRKTLDSCEET